MVSGVRYVGCFAAEGTSFAQFHFPFTINLKPEPGSGKGEPLSMLMAGQFIGVYLDQQLKQALEDKYGTLRSVDAPTITIELTNDTPTTQEVAAYAIYIWTDTVPRTAVQERNILLQRSAEIILVL